MKFLSIIVTIALFFSVVSSDCIPDTDSSSIPPCDNVNTFVGQTYRNNADNTSYYYCEDLNTPVLQYCGNSTLYSAADNTCVPANEWTYTRTCKYE